MSDPAPERGPAAPPALPHHAPSLPGRAVIRQRWNHCVFLHWRVDPARVAPLMPAGTRPDTFDGSAWVGLIPFVLSDHAFLPLPPVPRLGTFVEINVRTYSVDNAGNRGVVFASLEAEPLPSVLAAQALFGLPYRWARAGQRIADGTIEYRSRRRRGPHLDTGMLAPRTRDPLPSTRIHAKPSTTAVDTPLSRFLTDRWGFHETRRGRTIYARNRHEPWPLVEAELLRLDDGLLAAAGFADLAARKPDSVLATPLEHPGIITEFAAARAISV
ncbi:MAG: YqjF family protein [Microcella sp.]